MRLRVRYLSRLKRKAAARLAGMEAAAAAAAGGRSRRTTETRTTRSLRRWRGMGATPAALGLHGGEPCLGASTVDAVFALMKLMLHYDRGMVAPSFFFLPRKMFSD